MVRFGVAAAMLLAVGCTTEFEELHDRSAPAENPADPGSEEIDLESKFDLGSGPAPTSAPLCSEGDAAPNPVSLVWQDFTDHSVGAVDDMLELLVHNGSGTEVTLELTAMEGDGVHARERALDPVILGPGDAEIVPVPLAALTGAGVVSTAQHVRVGAHIIPADPEKGLPTHAFSVPAYARRAPGNATWDVFGEETLREKFGGGASTGGKPVDTDVPAGVIVESIVVGHD